MKKSIQQETLQENLFKAQQAGIKRIPDYALKPEVLAPAGNFESLDAAIKGGCDAVYFGIEKLNMRSGNTTAFNLKNLSEVCAIGRKAGIKLYVTLNTLLYNEDIPLMYEICDALKENGVDAVIASDMAAIVRANEIGLPVHISTQLSVSNIETVKFYARFAERIVLARELSLPQTADIIAAIHEQEIIGSTGKLLGIELFAHGALCLAVSGRCNMSQFQYHSSAGCGTCQQPCRRAYKLTDLETNEELVIHNKYVLSPTDLNTLGFVDTLIESGVASLKIEGRARSPEYVIRVVSAYRQAVDAWESGDFNEELVKKLNSEIDKVYNRGYSGGYYLGEKMDLWSGHYGSQATHRKTYFGKVLHYYPQAKAAEVLVEAAPVAKGDHLIINGPTSGHIELTLGEIRHEEKQVESASPGQVITFKVDERVRKSDRVYFFKKIGTR